MKRFGSTLLLLALTTTSPAFASTKVTVAQLEDKLASLQQAGKEDQAVADWLKGIDLSEQLSAGAKTVLEKSAPGQLTTDQIEILAGRSAFLPPPTSDLPAAPAPDAGSQRAILTKANDYATKVYAQNPRLLVSRTISRYEGDVQNTSSAPGLTVNSTNFPAVLVDMRTDPVETERGAEKPAPSRTKTKWGSNGQISEDEPGPALNVMLQDASSGKIDWLRWEKIEDKQIAVLSFAVDKKKSHLTLNYCCFPSTETETGVGTIAGPVQPVAGSIQSVTAWKPFKRTAGYRGELYIDPQTGTVVRTVTVADLKPTEFVHLEMVRTDYEPIVIDGKEFVLPAQSYTLTDVVPNADSGAGGYFVRHTLFNVRYANYQLRK